MTVYHIEPEHRTLHGAFSPDLAPVLTIDPGDTVRFRTLDADWNLEPRQSTRYDQPLPANRRPRWTLLRRRWACAPGRWRKLRYRD